MKKLLLYTIFFSVIGCKSNTESSCSKENTMEITFLKDSIRISLPYSWNKNDTLDFHDQAIVYHRNIMNQDTSCFALILVSDYSIYKDVSLSASDFFNRMRGKMEEINNGKDSLVTNLTTTINGHKVNFLKYQQIGVVNKVYDAHIGFILPQKKQVEIQLRLTEKNDGDADKILDCIFKSLEIK